MVRALVDRRPLGFVWVSLTLRRIEVNRHGSTSLRSARRGTVQHQIVVSQMIYSSHLFDATVYAPFLSVKLFHVYSWRIRLQTVDLLLRLCDSLILHI